MKKRFNVYSMGVLILRDLKQEDLKASIRRNKNILNRINNLSSNEITMLLDPDTGRQWEFERIK